VGTWSIVGGSHRTAWFTEPDPAAGVEQMAAVVVRRVDPSSAGESLHFRDLLRLVWWALLYKLRLRRSPRHAAKAPWELPAGWSGGVAHGTPGEVLYSRDRRIVRVRGHDYALAGADQTLILLVDETVEDAAPSVEAHAAPAPTAPWSPPDGQLDREEHRRRARERNQAASLVWDEWLEHEPSIRAFLESKPTRGAR